MRPSGDTARGLVFDDFVDKQVVHVSATSFRSGAERVSMGCHGFATNVNFLQCKFSELVTFRRNFYVNNHRGNSKCVWYTNDVTCMNKLKHFVVRFCIFWNTNMMSCIELTVRRSTPDVRVTWCVISGARISCFRCVCRDRPIDAVRTGL